MLCNLAKADCHLYNDYESFSSDGCIVLAIKSLWLRKLMFVSFMGANMCVLPCVCLCACVCFLSACLPSSLSVCAFMSASLPVCLYICLSVYVCLPVCVCASAYLFVCVCMLVYMQYFVCTCILASACFFRTFL